MSARTKAAGASSDSQCGSDVEKWLRYRTPLRGRAHVFDPTEDRAKNPYSRKPKAKKKGAPK